MSSSNRTRNTAVILTALVGIGAAVLSFDAQQKAAIEFGIDSKLAFIVPLVIDVSIVVFSVLGVYAASERIDDLKRYAAIWTGVSIGSTLLFNLSHAPKISEIIKAYYGLQLAFESVYAIAAPLFLAALVHGVIKIMEHTSGETKADVLQRENNQLKLDVINAKKEARPVMAENERLQLQVGEMQLGYSVWAKLAPRSKAFLTSVLIEQEMSNKEYADTYHLKAASVSHAKNVIGLMEVE